MQMTKLQETIKTRVFGNDKKGGVNSGAGGVVEFQGAAKTNTEFKFSKISGDHDFHLMISKEQEQVYNRMRDENGEMRECLRHLQKEIFEIVNLK